MKRKSEPQTSDGQAATPAGQDAPKAAGASSEGAATAGEESAAAASPVDTELPTHVVAVGASAGGLEALERLFRAMPDDTGMAFVVIQHLSPDFKSMMNELLERFTRMRAVPVENPEPVRRNVIYLLPPRKDLFIEGNVLVTRDRPADAPLWTPINTFFSSLAHAWGERSAAIVLSGTGSDGSRGILDVHATGGLVLVESPQEARFDGMPSTPAAWMRC
jgi:two-component system CheB/CheR fusion protein